MSADLSSTQLIGFENDDGLGGLLVQFGIFQDFRADLLEHLLDKLRQQHPRVVIESIELLGVPKCNLGGMQEQNGTLIRVQTLNAPLDLRLTLQVGSSRLVLDIQLVLICEGLDSTATLRSDMFIRAQKAAP